MDDSSSSAGSDIGGTDVDLGQLVTVLQIGNQVHSQIAKALLDRMQPPASKSQLAITGSSVGTLVKSGAGFLVSVSVTTPSTATTLTGTIYDTATVANSTNTNVFALIPSSGIQTYNWPFTSGLVVAPSTSGPQVVSVSYFSTS